MLGFRRYGVAVHERAGKDRDHGVAMPADTVTPRVQDGERQHDEREDREQMDRAPRTA